MVEFLPSLDAPNAVRVPAAELAPGTMAIPTSDGRTVYVPAADVWAAANKTPRWKAVHPAVKLIVSRWSDLVADVLPEQTAEFVDRNIRCGRSPWDDLAFVAVASELFIVCAPRMKADERTRAVRADVLHAVQVALSVPDWPAAKAIGVTGHVTEEFLRGVVRVAETTRAARHRLAEHFRTMFQPL